VNDVKLHDQDHDTDESVISKTASVRSSLRHLYLYSQTVSTSDSTGLQSQINITYHLV